MLTVVPPMDLSQLLEQKLVRSFDFFGLVGVVGQEQFFLSQLRLLFN